MSSYGVNRLFARNFLLHWPCHMIFLFRPLGQGEKQSIQRIFRNDHLLESSTGCAKMNYELLTGYDELDLLRWVLVIATTHPLLAHTRTHGFPAPQLALFRPFVAMRSKLFRNLALVNESEASPLQGQLWGWKAMSPSMSEGWVGGNDY